jgi:hypothetical protein
MFASGSHHKRLNAFQFCHSLTKIDIPASIEVIAKDAFCGWRETIRKGNALSNWATTADNIFLIDGLFQFLSIPFQNNSFHSVTLKLRKNKKIKKQIETRVQEAQELGACISSSPRSGNKDSELGDRTGSLIRDREEKGDNRSSHRDRGTAFRPSDRPVIVFHTMDDDSCISENESTASNSHSNFCLPETARVILMIM